MRLAIFKPSPDIADLVTAYCLCDDPAGSYGGQTISTAPQLVACICVQLGEGVLTEFRDAVPLVSYAGIQPRIRNFRPLGKARSLVIFLTPLGTIRFLPSNGDALYDEGHEIGGIVGDGEVARLRAAANAAADDRALGLAVDDWLRHLFDRRPARPDFLRLAEAMRQIGRDGRSVTKVAARLDLSERQLERSFREHLGVAPKRYHQICRVTLSLQAALSGRSDPLEGFADQAHQIRNWKAYLGFTPGHIRRTGPSTLGLLFQQKYRGAADAVSHYL